MGLVTTAPHAMGSANTVVLGQRSAAPRPPPGQRLGRYEVRDVIGRGAMGVVYRAYDPALGRAVAIKLVHRELAGAPSQLRMLGEAHVLAQLHHPNVIPIFDIGSDDTGPFVAMQLVDGGTLRDWLRRGRSFSETLDALVAAGSGLAAVHAAGIVHRDFKPENVLIGGHGEIYVADFGLARLTRSAARPEPVAPAVRPGGGDDSEPGGVVGTPAYMAPEQLRGEPSDDRADQFSFCVTLWEAIHGARPFRSPDRDAEDTVLDRLAAIAAGPRPRPPRADAPAWITPILLRGLAPERGQRWPSMQALLDAIAAHRTRRPRWRRLAIELGAVALTAALIAIARPTSEPPRSPRYAVVPRAHFADLRTAAISPDGSRFAYIIGGALGIEDRASGADRTLIARGVQPPIAWSPDGSRLLVGVIPALAPIRESVLVDVDTGAQRKLPVAGAASFLSDSEAVVAAAPRDHSVAVVRLDGMPEVIASCRVAGDYTFLWHPTGLPDGRIVVETETVNRAGRGLVVVDRSCRATPLASEPIDDHALSETGTIIALVKREGGDELVELSPDGKVMSRRRTTGALGGVIGRRRGVDYVTISAPRSELVRVHAGAAIRLVSLDGDVSMYPAPGGSDLAWITHAGQRRAGQLWLARLANLTRSHVALDGALAAGWSADGHWLAVLVDDDAGAPAGAAHRRSLVVLEPGRPATLRIALSGVDPEAAPVWLDERRVAVRSDDRARYRWYDLDSPDRGDHGEIGDLRNGSTLWLACSPRDGRVAMWRMGVPYAIDARTEHLWLQRPGEAATPLHVDAAVGHFLVPSWTPGGDLLVRALDSGAVSRVALDTGALSPIAQLPETPLAQLFDDHLVMLDDGDLLAVNHELGVDVAMVGPELAGR